VLTVQVQDRGKRRCYVWRPGNKELASTSNTFIFPKILAPGTFLILVSVTLYGLVLWWVRRG
jgi:hypothetical protein